MRLFGKVDGVIDRHDWGPFLLSPFNIQRRAPEPTVKVVEPAVKVVEPPASNPPLVQPPSRRVLALAERLRSEQGSGYNLDLIWYKLDNSAVRRVQRKCTCTDDGTR